MRFYGEMRVQGGGPLDGARFDALAYALAEIEGTDPAIEEVDLTSSLAQGWVTASMTIVQENLELAVAKLIATVRSAIYPNGDRTGGWQFLTETAGLSVHPVTDRAGMNVADQVAPPGPPAVPARRPRPARQPQARRHAPLYRPRPHRRPRRRSRPGPCGRPGSTRGRSRTPRCRSGADPAAQVRPGTVRGTAPIRNRDQWFSANPHALAS